MNNAKKPQRAARALNGSARGMGVLRRASDSIAGPLTGEIKYLARAYPRCSHPTFSRLRAVATVPAIQSIIVKTGAYDMPASLINDPEHWRDRAREKRALAERLRNDLAKETILRIADDYERLAQRAEERSRGSPEPK